jgi:hypothetical protein
MSKLYQRSRSHVALLTIALLRPLKRGQFVWGNVKDVVNFRDVQKLANIVSRIH